MVPGVTQALLQCVSSTQQRRPVPRRKQHFGQNRDLRLRENATRSGTRGEIGGEIDEVAAGSKQRNQTKAPNKGTTGLDGRLKQAPNTLIVTEIVLRIAKSKLHIKVERAQRS